MLSLQVYSARTALAGCKTLADMWSHQDTDQLQRLKDELTLLQDSGVVFPVDSWPARLLRSHPRYTCHSKHAPVCSILYAPVKSAAVLLQVFGHPGEHRGQSAAVLSQAGATPAHSFVGPKLQSECHRVARRQVSLDSLLLARTAFLATTAKPFLHTLHWQPPIVSELHAMCVQDAEAHL